MVVTSLLYIKKKYPKEHEASWDITIIRVMYVVLGRSKSLKFLAPKYHSLFFNEVYITSQQITGSLNSQWKKKLYSYWWNTRTKKSYLHCAQWRYYLYLSRVRILVSPWLLTLILTFWNRKYNYYCLYLCFITLYPSFITFLWQAFCDRWPL